MVRSNVSGIIIKNPQTLEKIEKEHRDFEAFEINPLARNNTGYKELAESLIPDHDGKWANKLCLVISKHKTATGVFKVGLAIGNFLKKYEEKGDIDVLSISAEVEDTKIVANSLIRVYGTMPDYHELYDTLGDNIEEDDGIKPPKSGHIVIPPEVAKNEPAEEEIIRQEKAYKEQRKIYDEATKEKPFLNRIEKYVPRSVARPENTIPLIYDLKTREQSEETRTPYEKFRNVFERIMDIINGTEINSYITTIDPRFTVDDDADKQFLEQIRDTIIYPKFVETGELAKEDVGVMMGKLYNALYRHYVVQDLIDDPQVSDINIIAPDVIRARIHGKSYLSNATFIDEKDMRRYIDAIAIRNGVTQEEPAQTFMDNSDENYNLRFELTAGYVTADSLPTVEIRKIPKHKLFMDGLIKAGMLTPILKDYILDCGRLGPNGQPNSNGIVFCGQPGSGKTTILNAYIEEAYEQYSDVLVIQENNGELFAERNKGIRFWNVVNYANKYHPAVSLEELGKMARVAGANVFVIGEVKGPEINAAIRLANSGCRTAITVHANSSEEAINQMANYTMMGDEIKDMAQAKRQLKAFQTIVFLRDFKVREITEVTGFDENTKEMTYRYIYRDNS